MNTATKVNRCFIGLGSNLNNPVRHIQDAFKDLSRIPNTKLVAQSGLWTSKPFGPQDQPDFINAVAELETALNPDDLLQHCQAIERSHNRIKQYHWGPRTLDLDILLYSDLTLDTKNLKIPHPEAINRNFVLLPLQQLDSKLEIHGQKLNYWLKQTGLNGISSLKSP